MMSLSLYGGQVVEGIVCECDVRDGCVLLLPSFNLLIVAWEVM